MTGESWRTFIISWLMADEPWHVFRSGCLIASVVPQQVSHSSCSSEPVSHGGCTIAGDSGEVDHSRCLMTRLSEQLTHKGTL
jgi:hypothetical protein